MFQLLHVSVLWSLLLFLPSALCDNLRCYYSPNLETHEEFELVVTECPPDELCFKADGRFGNYSGLSARGCMAKRGTASRCTSSATGESVYTMSYACCDRPYCNSCTVLTAGLLSITLTLVSVAVAVGSS